MYLVSSITANGLNYTPSPLGGLLAAGSVITITFTGIPITTTSITSSMTSSSTTTLSSTTTIQAVPAVQNQYLNHTGNGKYNGIVYAPNNTAAFSLKGSPLEGVHTNLLKNNIELNITVANQTQAPQQIKFSLSPVYQYIQINGTIVGSSANIDSLVNNVTYNFSVPQSWVVSQGISSGNIRLFKYDSGVWSSLSTTFTGSNATYYFYSALSNSFSNYAVGFATGNVISTTTPVSLTITPSIYTTYFFSGGGREHSTTAPTVTWTIITNDSIGADRENHTSIGWQTSSSTGTWTLAGTVSRENTTLTGIGANVIFANGKVVGISTTTTRVKTLTLSYNVLTANSFVIVMFASSNATTSVTSGISTGCTTDQYVSVTTSKGESSSSIITCNSVAVGNGYIANIVTTGIGAISIAAAIFPPYNVIFTDGPTTGNIVASVVSPGVQYANNAFNSSMLGTFTLNAISPGSTYTFNSWLVSSANLIVASPLTQNTYFTVEGNGILTATWNGLTTFSETGLPNSGEGWNVVYNSQTLNVIVPNSIVFSFTPGNYPYTVANVIISGNYIPSPLSGNAVAGSTVPITFNLANCFVSLSTNVINFGGIAPNANTPTSYSVTDNDLGTVGASIYLSGSAWNGLIVSDTFGIGNTLWSPTSLGTYAGNALSSSYNSMGIVIAPSGSNTIYFGLGIPKGTPKDTYTQNILIENSC